jgi:hypothetical protein
MAYLSIEKLVLRLIVLTACGGSSNSPSPDAGALCMPSSSAPTYTELYTRYFAPGTPGHCATSGCHGGANYNIWLCGTDKETCFRGMSTQAGLIDTSNPTASKIADPRSSPLIWIDPTNGVMPQDALGPFPEGRDAILAWVAACAQDN